MTGIATVMKVYLDNNILISIEEGEINLIELINSFKIKPQFVYSYTHIQELLEANDTESLIPLRTKTIKDVTNNFYAYPDGTTIGFKNENPDAVIQLYQSMKILNEMFRLTVQNFNIDRKWLLNKLSINKIEMNNVDPAKVIDT
jgi:hypothetical protein